MRNETQFMSKVLNKDTKKQVYMYFSLFGHIPVNCAEDKLCVFRGFSQRENLLIDLFESFLIKNSRGTFLFEGSIKRLDFVLSKVCVPGHLIYCDRFVAGWLEQLQEPLIGPVVVILFLEQEVDDPLHPGAVLPLRPRSSVTLGQNVGSRLEMLFHLDSFLEGNIYIVTVKGCSC